MSEKMRVDIQSDLALFVRDMVSFNGFDLDQYVNGLLEKGLYRDLEENYTPESVRGFMLNLVGNHQADWTLLQLPKAKEQDKE